MLIEVDDTVLILLSSCYIDGDISPWSKILRSDTPKNKVHFSKHIYFGLNTTVLTNPLISQVTNGMYISDYIAGFGNQNFCCTVQFSFEHSCLLT